MNLLSDNSYTIKDLESLTQIKGHTIRTWEKRYALLSPKRTHTNIRRYSNDELKKLLSIRLLLQRGFKISFIARMTDAELDEHVGGVQLHHQDFQSRYDQLIVSLMALDEHLLNQQIQNIIAQMGLEKAMTDVFFPLFGFIGHLWLSGTIGPLEEHLISNLIRQKIIAATELITTTGNSPLPSILLFLPEGELHELYLLFMNYLLKRRGFSTLYLGQSLPLNELLKGIDMIRPNFVIGIFTNPLRNNTTIDELIHASKKNKFRLLLSGPAMKKIESSYKKKVHFFKTLEEAFKIIDAK